MRRDLTRLAVVALAGAITITAYATFRIWDQGQRDERELDQVAAHRRAHGAGMGRDALSVRDTSCTSAPIRSSTGRCVRSVPPPA